MRVRRRDEGDGEVTGRLVVAADGHLSPVATLAGVPARTTANPRAFAYGYLSHLASDVYSHNHFVPCRLVTCYEARALRHLYWEARFDGAQPGNRWQLVGQVMAHRYDDCDDVVERVVERTLFSFRTNKRIFSSLMAVQQLEQWHAMVRQVANRSRYDLSPREVDRFNEIFVETIRDLRALNSIQGLTLPFLATAIGIFLIRQGFLGIPKDLRDASTLDGHERALERPERPIPGALRDTHEQAVDDRELRDTTGHGA